jgi:hypothetical protein
MDAPLTPAALAIANRTISSNAFFYITAHNLINHTPLSVIRMGDGERLLLEEQRDPSEIIKRFDDKWLARMGMSGLTYGELRRRLDQAVLTTDYFAPSISGLVNKSFDLNAYFTHSRLVDNFFVNQWDTAQKQELMAKADGILLIHANPELADTMQKKHTRFQMTFLKLTNWDQTEDVIEKAKNNPAQLVLFSGGCAGKYIGPEIAKEGKVVLDVGNSASLWL